MTGWKKRKIADAQHSCSYECDRPECIKAQRDELRDRLEAQQRKPLTDEEIKRMAAPWFLSMYWPLCNTFARAIEAAHGIKENT